MALITCGECGGQVSEKAVACPACGNPVAPTSAAADSVRRGSSRSRFRHDLAYWLIVVAVIAGVTVGTLISAPIGLVVMVVGGVAATWWGYS